MERIIDQQSGRNAMPIVVEPSGRTFGARVRGLDLAAIDDRTFPEAEKIFHQHQVVAFCDQVLDEKALIGFGRRFGELERHVSSEFQHPQYGELTVLSNILKDGKPYGSPDAGQGWHTD